VAKLTPEAIGAKYAQRTGAATADWVNGIQSVTESPGVAAARAADKWATNVASAKDKFARNAGAVTTQEWAAKSVAKQSRYAQGTQEGANAMVMFQREFQPFQQSVTAKVKAMPSTTLEQRLERARQQALLTAAFRKK